MNHEYVHPFLESARIVIEQVAGVKPSAGEFGIKEITKHHEYLWIHIGLTGQMNGDIIYGLHEAVALKMVSAMMGGYVLDELGEMGHSAISELSNMISGNASTMLYNQGVRVDITPPKILSSTDGQGIEATKVLSIPLTMEGIGELDIQLLIA
ncbi:chemotaxis protein CheX [Paenibacillus antri]|uniref:Chemotaxis protein CheX n=1 Tax=Paenibacillus antri TaxID=2582848 RepID=A0A5R9GCG1_9BACL|nr:chemotaxis protein CheX [Paenibacillus antri]TLS53441.1 chemotaxis protein CheX [Paenibacillus antri]